MKKKTLFTISCFMFLCAAETIAQNWTVGGNTTGAAASFGTIDGQRIDFISNSVTRGKLSSSGLWSFGNTTPLAQVHINSKSLTRNPLQVDVLDTAKMIVYNNGGMAVGNVNTPPANGLFVSGKVGIGTNVPDAKLHVTGGSEVQLSSGGSVVIGPIANENLAIDRDEIQARKNGAANTLHLNEHGGNVNIANDALVAKELNGFVGIGTSTPDAKLNVIGGTDVGLNGGGTIVAGDVSVANLAIDNNEIQTRSNGAAAKLFINDNGGDVSISSGAIYVNGTTKQIGFGTSSPGAPMHIISGTDVTLGGGGYIITGTTSSTNLAMDDNEIEARSNGAASTLFLNRDGGDFNVGDGNLVVSGSFNNVGIKTPPLNNHTLQIGAGGDVLGIGNAETLEDFDNFTIGTNSNFVTLTDDMAQLGTSLRRWRSLYAIDGTINTSDERDKTNIKDLNYGLKEIMKLRSVSFNWKNKINTDNKIGLIAQELQKVLPEVVRDYEYKKDEATGKEVKVPASRLGVMYADIIPVLIRAIQEQQKEIEELKNMQSQSGTNEKTGNKTIIAGNRNNDATVTTLNNTAVLEQNIPNPLSNFTSIRYALPSAIKNAQLLITDASGKTIKQVKLNKVEKGIVNINASLLHPGTYNYSLITDGKIISTKKMVVNK